MKKVEFWRWRYRSEITGKIVATRYHLNEEDALSQWPDAVRVEHSLIVRDLPEGPHEHHFTNPPHRPG